MTVFHIADCPTCGTPQAQHWHGRCYTCQFWAEQFTTPGGLIIGGNHYSIGEEPPAEKLAACPNRYGSYGLGFRIHRIDGVEIVTHNLWHQGAIPPGLVRPDNAAIIAAGADVPWPAPSHRHTEHLRHHAGDRLPYPYQCTFNGCHCFFLNAAEAAHADHCARTGVGGDRP